MFVSRPPGGDGYGRGRVITPNRRHPAPVTCVSPTCVGAIISAVSDAVNSLTEPDGAGRRASAIRRRRA
jgi:hypothetical protein